MIQTKQLSDLIVKAGIITKEDLEIAIQKNGAGEDKLRELLISSGLCTSDEVDCLDEYVKCLRNGHEGILEILSKARKGYSQHADSVRELGEIAKRVTEKIR